MYIRAYRSTDCPALAELFHQTVHSVNAGDYTREQLDAWSPGHVDLPAWDRSFSRHLTLVALEGRTVVGFGDMDGGGYLDRLYVHKDFQGQGIATALCDRLEEAVHAPKFTTHASITARPFFLGRGYGTVREQEVERHGVRLVNFVMEKPAPADARPAPIQGLVPRGQLPL